MSFQKITLIGNLGRDPELRYTPQGDAVCNFTMATTDRKKDKSGEFQDITLWFKVTLWRNQAENAAKYLAKGRQVYIEGRLAVEEWTDRENKERYTLAVTATDMQFIGSRAEGSGDVDRSRQYDQTARSPEFPTHSGGQPPQAALPAATAATTATTRDPLYPVPPPLKPDDDIPF